MDIQRSSYTFIAVFVIVMFLAIGSEARAEIYDPKCPGVCSPGIVPDCKTLCGSLGINMLLQTQNPLNPLYDIPPPLIRSSYTFIAVFVIVMFLAIGSEARAEIYDPKCPEVCSPGIVPDCKTLCGSEARAEIYDPKCPGVCSPGIVPDCKTLCGSLGYHAGGYCKGLTCCCKTKIL
ncbi:unnamed protein product [Thlaspi arvense]|uniref:Uncharacterized protein n=1 Tax=Thlaspi arvense TaxID=13288 RepID=A0AAU9RP32_THLAR|nr:unnamed protein product [Thlaspi arvense]